MSGHLPECPKNWAVPGDCACEIIRVCEERVLDACLNAVRNVAAKDDNLYWNIRLPRLIDALRGEQ